MAVLMLLQLNSSIFVRQSSRTSSRRSTLEAMTYRTHRRARTRIASYVFVLLLPVVSVACLDEGYPPPTGVQGTVTNAATKAPIPGATVAAANRHVATGAEGRFTLLDIGEGRITVRVTHPEYVEAEREVVSVAKSSYPTVDFALTPKQ